MCDFKKNKTSGYIKARFHFCVTAESVTLERVTVVSCWCRGNWEQQVGAASTCMSVHLSTCPSVPVKTAAQECH